MSIPSKIFVNVNPPFAGQIGVAYATRELADQMASHARVACIEVNLMTPGLVSTGYVVETSK